MLKRLRIAALVTGLLLILGLAAGACGGGGDALTLEEFFQELEALDDQFEPDSNAIDAQFEELSDEEFLDEGPDLMRQSASLINEFSDALEDLNAPDEAADLKDEAVSAGRDVAEQFNDLADQVEEAETVEELSAVFDDEEFNTAIDRYDQACLDAEALAADNDITIDLNCEE